MKNVRNKSYAVGKTLFTNMTSAEVKKLDKIMNPAKSDHRPMISLREYIDRFSPSVRCWISKSGNAMCEIEILRDKIEGHLCLNSTITQQEAHLDTVYVYLKAGAE